jgi:hypothetical protein
MANSTSLIGISILLAFIGMLVAALYVFVIGFSGLLGSLTSEYFARNSEKPAVSILGLILSILGQTYASLAFVALIIQSVASWVGDSSGFGKWVLWIVGFAIAIAPSQIALKDATAQWRDGFREQSVGRTTSCYATTFVAPITIIGFLLFIFFPNLLSMGWGWIPHF